MMSSGYRRLLVIVVSLFWTGMLRAQSGSSRTDSLRSYELSEIVVGGDTVPVRSVSGVRRVSLASIVRQDAHSAADLVRLLPSAHLQVNSRGETLIYFRGGSERQVSVFFDGALLNIPWDNRIDISSLPVGMLGGVEVSQGVPSVVYGTNVVGGAVNLQSRMLSHDGKLSEITGEVGSESTAAVRGQYIHRGGEWTFLSSASLFSSDGFSLPAGGRLPFGQPDSNIRTNTDRTLQNAFVRVGRHTTSGGVYGFSMLHINGTRGVAPEGHLDPTIDRVRYWRYPLWRNTMWIGNAESVLGVLGSVRATGWIGRFSQHIVQYEGPTYETPVEKEEDQDTTIGARIISSTRPGPGVLHVSINLLASTHDQSDFQTSSTVGEPVRNTLVYRQRTLSLGAEYMLSDLGRWTVLVGASLDRNATPDTGDKPSRGVMTDYSVTSGLDYRLSDSNSIRISSGRKVRFPTMRELFGDALKRFQVNPDLVPESSWIGELAFEQYHGPVTGILTTFFRRTYHTIDQENIVVNGVRKRRRINLSGSRVFGVEAVGTTRLSSRVKLEAMLTWLKADAFTGNKTSRLVEKPDVLGTFSVDASTRFGATLLASAVYTGHAWALSPDDSLKRLPNSVVLNARLSIRKYASRNGLFTEFYAGVNNLLDRLTLPQLGLPGVGRTYRFGISLSF